MTIKNKVLTAAACATRVVDGVGYTIGGLGLIGGFILASNGAFIVEVGKAVMTSAGTGGLAIVNAGKRMRGKIEKNRDIVGEEVPDAETA